jgi:DNA-binding NtrC family response regulator
MERVIASGVRSMGEKILVLDSDRDYQKVAGSILGKAGYDATAVEDWVSGLQTLREEGDFAAVLVREGADGAIRGLDLLQGIKAISPDTPVVVSATSWTPQSIQHCTRFGAFFCIEKGAEDELLVKVLNKAIEEHRLSSSKKSA